MQPYSQRIRGSSQGPVFWLALFALWRKRSHLLRKGIAEGGRFSELGHTLTLSVPGCKMAGPKQLIILIFKTGALCLRGVRLYCPSLTPETGGRRIRRWSCVSLGLSLGPFHNKPQSNLSRSVRLSPGVPNTLWIFEELTQEASSRETMVSRGENPARTLKKKPVWFYVCTLCVQRKSPW